MQFAPQTHSGNQKKLLVTFDYELFLGNRSGSVDECMIVPTNKVMALLEKYGVSAIFFVDTTYLLRLKKQAGITGACADDFRKIADQLCLLVRKGHYVFPHLHPHWLDAEYLSESNQWRLNKTDKYLFTNISEKERDVVFDGSVSLLKDILHPQFPDYKINAFRAGGWSIQPFTDFKPYFEKHLFLYEFSVLGGFYQFTDAQYFDFSAAPSKSIYRFNSDVCIEDAKGPYLQFNISSINIPPTTSWINRLWMKFYMKITKDHTFNKGEGQPSRIINSAKPASPHGRDLASSNWERVAIELLTRVKLQNYLNYLKSHDYMHFISHPKMITGHNLVIFDKFLKKAFEKYPVVTNFQMMIPE